MEIPFDTIESVTAFIESIDNRDTLAQIERVVTRTRMRIGAAERAAREADPEYQRRMAELQAEVAREQSEWERKQAAREARIASSPVLGTFKIGNIRPRYLVGKTVDVIGVNDTTYRVNFPDSPEFRTWAGRVGCRISKSAGEFTPGATRES